MSDPIARLNAALEDRYHIERELGEGGMATVYLADDLKHERKVALKVLKPELAAVMGAERFLAEIKTTANLQHPHILPLHDSGEADGFLFYVMPFIEGETLADRLEREKQLPVTEAVKIATDVAEALHAAHEQGVIHRDVKPANILMSAGRPLVADFGIALAVSAAGGGRLTETGLSMGTPYYMSPEQAAADREPSPASDVYSLGCVLYEMLVGDPPHTGSSAQAVLAKILTEDAPEATKTRASIPRNVDAAIRQALQKLPADRFSGAHEFARALGDAGFGGDAGAARGQEEVAGPWKGVALAATAAVVVLGGALVWSLTRPSPGQPVSRYSIIVPEAAELQGASIADRLTFAPDGGAILLVGSDGGGGQQLWLRPRDQLVATPVPATAGAINPAISPDGQRFAFVDVSRSPRALMAGTFGGGPPVTLTDSLVDRGGVAYGYDGYVYYDGHLEGDGIARIAEGGGTPEVVTMPRTDDGEDYHVEPNPLPDGQGLLFTASIGGGWGIGAADLTTGEHRILATGALGARYSPTGHLLYVATDGTLIARPFDTEALEFTGDPVAIVGGIQLPGFGRSSVALANDGTLLYVAGGEIGSWEPVWVDREGQATPVDPAWERRNFARPALAPDDSRVAITIQNGDDFEVWLKRLDQPDVPAQVFEVGGRSARWTDGGATLSYLLPQQDGWVLHRRPADGSAPAEPMLRYPGQGTPSFSDDGAWIAWMDGADIFAGRLDSLAALTDTPPPLLGGPDVDFQPALSPDGLWMAYTSNRSNSMEIYVCPMPGCEVQHRVSTSGGVQPTWSPDGTGVFYLERNGATMMEADVIQAGSFQRGSVRALFGVTGMHVGGFAAQYDVDSEGERFLMLRRAGADEVEEIIIVENFFEELKARVPN